MTRVSCIISADQERVRPWFDLQFVENQPLGTLSSEVGTISLKLSNSTMWRHFYIAPPFPRYAVEGIFRPKVNTDAQLSLDALLHVHVLGLNSRSTEAIFVIYDLRQAAFDQEEFFSDPKNKRAWADAMRARWEEYDFLAGVPDFERQLFEFVTNIVVEILERWPSTRVTGLVSARLTRKKKPGGQKLDREERIRRLVGAHKAMDLLSRIPKPQWKDIVEEIKWHLGTDASAIKKLQYATDDLKRLQKRDPEGLLKEVGKYLERNETD